MRSGRSVLKRRSWAVRWRSDQLSASRGNSPLRLASVRGEPATIASGWTPTAAS